MTALPAWQVSPARGLAQDEAALLLAEHGPNRVPEPLPPAMWRRVYDQLRDPLILVLLVAMVVTLVTGDWTDAGIVAFVVVTNTTVGVAQERGADRAVAALSRTAAPEAHVFRDGRLRSLPTELLVPGDTVALAEGDIVPADGELTEAVRLLVDESALTGESLAVEKDTSVAAAMSAGTVVARGRGVMLVTRTGADSALGRIATLVAAAPPRTPLQRRLAELGRTLAIAAGALSLVVFVLGVARGQGIELMAVTALSLVVAAVPESLPTVVTLALALGARRMAQRHAIVRHLAAVETLGSVTIVATDKTGTLTRGDMVAAAAWTPQGSYRLPCSEQPLPTSLSRLLQAAALCNDADVRAAGGSAIGDPTEIALLSAAAAAGWTRERADSELPRVDEIPFQSSRRQMSTVHRCPAGDFLVVSKGAPETLLTDAIVMADADLRDRALAEARRLADEGQRVLAFAVKRTPTPPCGAADTESGLELLGLVGVTDPVRETSAATVASFLAAGVVPVIITGDNEATAHAVAQRVGLPTRDRKTVFARATPEDKLRIIREFQEAGQVVAMTGDGVNDAPALRQADIGIAMGIRGTEAARQTADLVLADDALESLTAAIEEGRRAYDNVRRFLLFGLAGGTAEIAVMLGAPLLGMPVPLLPSQILWTNLLTHGLPGVAMGAEPSEPDTLQRPPRPPSETVLGAGLWQRIALLAGVVAAVSLLVGLWARTAGAPWQTLMFTSLTASQLGVASGARSRGKRGRNVFLPLAIAGAFLLQLAAVYLPLLQDVLGTKPLTLPQLTSVTALAGLAYATTRRLRTGTAGPPEDHGPLVPVTSGPSAAPVVGKAQSPPARQEAEPSVERVHRDEELWPGRRLRTTLGRWAETRVPKRLG